MSHRIAFGALLGSASLLALSPQAAQAQTPAATPVEQTPAGEVSPEGQQLKITVTGSYIQREDFVSASPIEVISTEQLQVQGVNQVTDIIRNLTVNYGSRTAFDQANNGRGGISSFNLRGLGSTSTLTLFNGRRVAPRATNANVFPLQAIGRVEVLKDGASALYGADAVAGVVNLISRQVEGLELSTEYLTSTDLGDNTQDLSVSAAFGTSTEDTRLNLFFTYLQRLPSYRADPFLETSSSRTIPGFPGTFIVRAPAPTTGPLAGRPVGFRFVDPLCGTIGETVIVNPGAANVTCGQPTVTTLPYISNYDQTSFMADAEHDVSGRITARVEFLFSDLTDRPSEFVNNVSGASGIVPANHPDNIYGVPLTFVGAPGVFEPGERDQTTFTYRVTPSLEVELSDTWRLDLAYNYFYEEQSNTQRAQNVSPVRLQDALNGIGGQNRNQRFNPFGTALTNPARANSKELLDFITPESITIAETQYETIDGVLAGELPLSLPGGPVGMAVGAQSRRERFEQDLDPLILGYAAAGGLLADRQSVSTNPPERRQQVTAAFAEFALPILDTLEASLAIRHEDYGGGIGDTQDPKVAVRWEALDWLTLRGSYGTSFRAPTPAQLDPARPTASNLPYIDPRSGPNCTGTQSAFTSGFATGNPNLKPEKSTNYNFGVQADRAGFRVGVDYFNFSFEDQVARSSGQSIILADCLATNGGPPQDPRITVGPLGNITGVALTLDNLSTIETDGVDLSVGYTLPLGPGELDIAHQMTFLASYDIQNVPGGPVIDGAGSRNKLTNSVSTPEIRSNTTLSYLWGGHRVTAIGRYISEYREDVSNVDLDAYPTLDLQYAYSFGPILDLETGPSVELGAINVFNERPPVVNETLGVDSSVADPRGRMVYIRLRQAL
jgi:iron complex outermembrane receptor protein